MFAFLLGCKTPDRKNHLATATSPYLLEHADNPVEWYEWGKLPLAVATKENKPLLISIGYAACHWCHVMEKESFMDTSVARIMNENFICIKVDREERPDIDNIYMNALQLLSGGGGWPLNAFALPDGKPFFAGTYYSKTSWKNLLQEIAAAYKKKHDLVLKQAESILNGIRDEELLFVDTSLVIEKAELASYTELFDSIYAQSDLKNGGFKGTPKFPFAAFTEFMLQHYYLTGNQEALKIATTTLNKMALGGIYDQVGGGFARYATDSQWHIPHFEKMLYDNGQLISLYSHAYQVTKNEFYKNILSQTIDFIEINLSATEGGFYSSLNADTKEGEGKYYTWTASDFNNVVGDNKIIPDYFHISTDGNWKDGENILYAKATPGEFAIENKMKPEEFAAGLQNVRKRLLELRNNRNKPTVDTKILTAWNGMMIKGLVDAYMATGTETYFEKAKKAAIFLEKFMIDENGNVKRNFKDGVASIDGFLDDYAWTAAALIRLYEAGFDIKWLSLARKITDRAINIFFNKTNGLFFYTGMNSDAGMILRKTEISDNTTPSSNAIMARVLYNLGTIYDDSVYINSAKRMYTAVFERVKNLPRYHIQWCNFAGLLSGRVYEIIIMGKDALQKNKKLQQTFLPTSILMGGTREDNLPLVQDKLLLNKTLIYVCTKKYCKKPVEEVSEALMQVQ